MGINSTEVSYNFGQLGSVYTTSSNDAITPPTGKVFVAFTTLATTTFDDHGGLVAQQDSTAGLEYISTEDGSGVAQTAHDAVLSPDLGESGAGGLVIASTVSFPSGITVFGRWTEIDVDGGAIIAYIGN
tara:strand:+ start:81 stop:467 length:387 start_codon:yes stop_codon:yes gene_type:complete